MAVKVGWDNYRLLGSLRQETSKNFPPLVEMATMMQVMTNEVV